MSFIITCPHCQEKFQAEDEWEGGATSCPSCGEKIIIQRDDNDTVADDGTQSSDQETIKGKVDETIRAAFNLKKLDGFSFSRFMRQVFKRHSWEETETYLAQGTPTTTPLITEVDTTWPAPWFFVRALLFSMLFYWLVGRELWGFFARHFEDTYTDGFFYRAYLLIPLWITGVIGIPFSALLFFWEVNVPKNVSIISLVRITVISGFVSLIISLLFFKYISTPTESAIWAGPIEETAKLLTMMLFFRNKKYSFKLNGLLIGAAVGTGFAIIETGGYVIRNGNEIMELRALHSPFGHIAYSAIVGFALWRVKGKSKFSFSALFSRGFIPLFLFAVGLHMFWNSSLLSDVSGIKNIIVGFIEYTVIIYLIQEGINEVRKIKSCGGRTKAAKAILL